MPNYIGSTKTVKTKYGEIIKLGLNQEHLEKLTSELNERGWVNIEVKPSKSGGWYSEIEAPREAVAQAPASQTEDSDLF